MDNNKKDAASMVDGWLKEIMDKLDVPQTDASNDAAALGPDEQAIASAGLTHPDDMELERIVQETIAENWGDDSDTQPQEESTPTHFFKAPEVPSAPIKEPEDIQDIPEEEAFNDAVIRKLRPKAKKGDGLFGIPHIISTAIWLLLIVVIGIWIGRTVWLCAEDVLALGKEGKEVTITIEVQDDIPAIAEKLKKADMIRYPKLFKLFTDLTGKGDNMLVGPITFDSQMVYDYNALVNALSYKGSSRVTIDVMIPEGYNCAQIFALLDEKGVCAESELEKYAAEGELEGYWFLDGIERGHKYCLEGFLFPDTYEFYVKDEPSRVIHKLLNGFEYRFTDRMVDKFVALNNKTGLDLTIRDVVTMASIVEKEKASDVEGYSIASVFYNRLTHSASYPFLNSDATIKYDTDFRSKGQLVTNALINASPYNTYTKKGLPAGPIANPGLSSLDAALDPEDTSYYYFIYDKEAGMHRFSKTLAEHSAWAKKLGLS